MRIRTAFGLVRIACHGRLDVGRAMHNWSFFGFNSLLFAYGCCSRSWPNYSARTTARARHAMEFNPHLQGWRRRVVAHSRRRPPKVGAGVGAGAHASSTWLWHKCFVSQAMHKGSIAALQGCSYQFESCPVTTGMPNIVIIRTSSLEIAWADTV